MSNGNSLQVLHSINEIAKQLEPELAKLVENLKSDLIPTAAQCEKLCDMLEMYIAAVKPINCKAAQASDAKQIRFANYAGSINTNKEKALFQNDAAVYMLCRLGLEKLVSLYDDDVDQTLLNQLVDAKLIACINDEVDQGNDEYFTLTTKGNAWLMLKEFQKKAEDILPFFPAQLGVDPDNWTELTFRRARMIHRYFRKTLLTRGYIMFAFANNQQLLFGCEITDAIDVSYVCPYIIEGMPSEEDADMLCAIIASQEVKKLTFISAEAMGLNDMPSRIKNTAAAVDVNIDFIKLEA